MIPPLFFPIISYSLFKWNNNLQKEAFTMFHLKNYRQTFILLLSMVLGVIAGLLWKEKAMVLAPLGDLFLNLLLVIIPPLIFLTISTSIAKITTPKRLRKNSIGYLTCFISYFSRCSMFWHSLYVSNITYFCRRFFYDYQ